MDWLLPEIVDSRRARGMPLREKESSSFKNFPESLTYGNKEKESSPKRQRLSKEDSPLPTYPYFSSDEDNENDPIFSRQLRFDEM
jgi:hypothetical protein